jgi:hypothetical protein
VTSLKLEQEAPSEIVHRRTAVPTTLVTVLTLEAGVVMVAVPENKVHVPVSVIVGLLPANVKFPLLHWLWFVPAFDAVTPGLLNVITTSSKVEAQGALLIVHLKI